MKVFVHTHKANGVQFICIIIVTGNIKQMVLTLFIYISITTIVPQQQSGSLTRQVIVRIKFHVIELCLHPPSGKVSVVETFNGFFCICNKQNPTLTCVIMINWFNGTSSTNRLYHAFEEYVAVKIVKLMRKLTMLRVGNTYNKPLK